MCVQGKVSGREGVTYSPQNRATLLPIEKVCNWKEIDMLKGSRHCFLLYSIRLLEDARREFHYQSGSRIYQNSGGQTQGAALLQTWCETEAGCHD